MKCRQKERPLYPSIQNNTYIKSRLHEHSLMTRVLPIKESFMPVSPITRKQLYLCGDLGIYFCLLRKKINNKYIKFKMTRNVNVSHSFLGTLKRHKKLESQMRASCPNKNFFK
jgi:hypothetical protein